MVRRDPGSKSDKDAGPTLDAFKAAYPGIIAAMSPEQLTVWREVIAGWAANKAVDEALARHERRERSTWLYPNSTDPIIASDYLEAHARIAARRKFVDEGKSRAELDPALILSPEIAAQQPWNVDAENRYRTWAIRYFSSQPLVAELTSGREIVSALTESQEPGIGSGIPHVNLLWAGSRIKHTKGIVTWEDLMDIRVFSDRYRAEVTDSPAIQALRAGIRELDSHINAMKSEHQARSAANAEHPWVRHVSEALGSPTQIKLMVLRLRVQQNPGDLDARALLAEKEAEAGDYPKMKDDPKSPGIWHDPDLNLSAARRFLEEEKFELAAAALTECERSTTLATARFAGYERRVMQGAGTALKWLDRAKKLGKIASAFTGTGGVVRAAIGAAGYSFAQEGSQQVVAHWIDSSSKIDLEGLAQQAAVEGLASMFGGITQGAFVNALTARFGARIMGLGLNETNTRAVLSWLGATTSAFYNVPAEIALRNIIKGEAAPSSLAEVCSLVVDEAVKSAAMDIVGSYVHSAGPKGTAEPAAPGAGPEIAAPKEVLAGLSRTPQERNALQQALPSDLADRVPLVENPALRGQTVLVVYKYGRLHIQVGPAAKPSHVTAHINTARQLLRYEGVMGKGRRLLDQIKSFLPLHRPGFGTEGFVAALEVAKLRGIESSLEATLSTIDARAQRLTEKPELATQPGEREAIQRELDSIRDQIGVHQKNIDSYAPGRGFVAALEPSTHAAFPGIQAELAKIERTLAARPDQARLFGMIDDVANLQAKEDVVHGFQDWVANVSNRQADDLARTVGELGEARRLANEIAGDPSKIVRIGQDRGRGSRKFDITVEQRGPGGSAAIGATTVERRLEVFTEEREIKGRLVLWRGIVHAAEKMGREKPTASALPPGQRESIVRIPWPPANLVVQETGGAMREYVVDRTTGQCNGDYKWRRPGGGSAERRKGSPTEVMRSVPEDLLEDLNTNYARMDNKGRVPFLHVVTIVDLNGKPLWKLENSGAASGIPKWSRVQ